MATALKDLSVLELADLMRRQAMAVYAACETPVADDLSASLKEAADRLIDLNRRAFLNSGDC